MAKVVKNITSWKEFLDELPPLNTHREWVYRGQSAAKWKLEPSISRYFDYIREHLGIKKIVEEDYEYYMLQNFKKSARLYADRLPNEDDDLEWLAIMQHYGCPTRLLDFSFTPYIALFFAASSGNTDFSLFIIPCEGMINNGKMLGSIKINKKTNVGKVLSENVVVFEPKIITERQLLQQSVFLCPTTIRSSVERCILNQEFLDEAKKLIINKNLRWDFLRELNKMNINTATLFPGMQGYCESLKMLPLYNTHSLRHFSKS